MHSNVIMLLLIQYLLQYLPVANGLTKYNCGSAFANLTTVSLLTIEECDIPSLKVSLTRLKLQLFQANDFRSVSVRLQGESRPYREEMWNVLLYYGRV